MSKSSGFAPTPQGLSRPNSPGPALGAGFINEEEDRQALMMGPLGESRRSGGDKDSKDTSTATPAPQEQSEFVATDNVSSGDL